jgi:hypothetical protein
MRVLTLMVLFVLLLVNPSFANVWDDVKSLQFQRTRTVEETNGVKKVTTTVHIERTQTSEIMRRQDLRSALANRVASMRDAWKTQMDRLMDMARTRQNFMDNKTLIVNDLAQRNRQQLEIARMRQETQLRMIADRTAAINQTIKDRFPRPNR